MNNETQNNQYVNEAEHVMRCRCGGFTMIEMLCAGVILAICGTVIGALTIRQMTSIEMSRDYQAVAVIVDEVFTKVDVIGPARIMLEGPTEGQSDNPAYERFSWDLEVEENEEHADLYEIDLTVQWQVNGGIREYKAHTALYDPSNSRTTSLNWGDI
ncbi:prepilin-type N-terminal cleavage/methylation domain-containing protein [Planctomycetota bacterium]|nr:prepilin-type N-terminal cleavage/methylation domain-containing protein [Planctomycetota bacterium]